MQLAIIVPYKNRKDFLDIFIDYVPKYLEQYNGIKDYNIVISEQLDDIGFNRGLSVNAGIAYCIKYLQCDYVVGHNVDMIPVKNIDYSYKNCFIGWFLDAGGFNCSLDDFIKINGYCNTYYGWGTEDTDLLDRAGFYNLDIKKWEKEFAPFIKPIICNLEFKNHWNAKEMSKQYWGTDWPLFITPQEYGLPETNIDKRHQWHEHSLMKINEHKRDSYRVMSNELKNQHYQNSGLNQIKCNFTKIISEKQIHYLSYRINDLIGAK